MADDILLPRRSAFAGHIATLPTGAGDVVIAERTGLGIATLMSRGVGAPMAIGIDLPQRPAVTLSHGSTAVATGAGTWLLVEDQAAPDWARNLATRIGATASLVDQSSGYAVLRLSGEGARALLSRGAFIDLHPDAFSPGSAAVTLIAHMGIILWQREASPTYEVALFRSLADSFWHWLVSATAGANLRIVRA